MDDEREVQMKDGLDKPEILQRKLINTGFPKKVNGFGVFQLCGVSFKGSLYTSKNENKLKRDLILYTPQVCTNSFYPKKSRSQRLGDA